MKIAVYAGHCADAVFRCAMGRNGGSRQSSLRTGYNDRMIPIRDDNPHFITPYATYAIVALNMLAWVIVQALGTEPGLSRSVCTLGLVPGELLQSSRRQRRADRTAYLLLVTDAAQSLVAAHAYVSAWQLDAHPRQPVVLVDLRQ